MHSANTSDNWKQKSFSLDVWTLMCYRVQTKQQASAGFVCEARPMANLPCSLRAVCDQLAAQAEQAQTAFIHFRATGIHAPNQVEKEKSGLGDWLKTNQRLYDGEETGSADLARKEGAF